MAEHRDGRAQPSRNSINPGASQQRPRKMEMGDSSHRFVFHIPFRAASLSAALATAKRLADFFTFLSDFDRGETTVTYEGDQEIHHRVICDRRLPTGGRCCLRHGHSNQCGFT